MRRNLLVLSPLLLASWAGCTCPGQGAPNTPELDLSLLEAIRVEPADQTLFLSDGRPATSTYAVIGVFSDGTTAEVTSHARLELGDSALGRFSGNQFQSTTARGGTTRVFAEVNQVGSSTGLQLVFRQVFADPASAGLPGGQELATLFGGPTQPSRAPTLVYPNDGVLLPPNLGKLEFHFLPGPGNTLFELAFRNATTEVVVHLRCAQPLGEGCIYLPEPGVWTALAKTNAGGDPLEVSLRGTDEQGSSVGSSASLRIGFSHSEIRGGLYYWTTSAGTGIMRFDFAAGQSEAERFIGTQHTGGTCVGCHALSRDGRKIVAEAGGQNDGRLLLFDVAQQRPVVPFPAAGKSIFQSWNHDGSQFVGVYADKDATNFNLMLFSGETGGLVGDIPGTGTSAQPANHPDWSADGNKIAYTQTGVKNTNQRMFRGAIKMVTRNGSTWSEPLELVSPQQDKNRFYPAIAPSNDLLVFNESTCPAGTSNSSHRDCNADSDPSAKLLALRLSPGATPVYLTRANAPGPGDGAQTELTNSYPKWSPFVFQRTGEFGSRLLWLTFSSSRNYGLRSPPAGGSENPRGTLLWMVAFDSDKLEAGEDPSSAAFALPFQDLTTSNHIAQWAERVVPPIH